MNRYKVIGTDGCETLYRSHGTSQRAGAGISGISAHDAVKQPRPLGFRVWGLFFVLRCVSAMIVVLVGSLMLAGVAILFQWLVGLEVTP